MSETADERGSNTAAGDAAGERSPELKRAAEEEAKAHGSDAGDAGDEPTSAVLRRFAARREAYERAHPLVKVGILGLGFLLIVAGIVLSGPGVPGPGFLVIALGLSLLAFEFTWAERLLYRAVVYLEKSQQKAKDTSTATKVAAVAAAALAVAAYVVAAIEWEIPVLPG